MTSNNQVKVYVTQDFKVYLVNEGASPLALEPGEIFGFGLGGFGERLARTVIGANDCLGWLVRSDSQMLVTTKEDNGGKQAINLASLVASMAHEHGIMDVQISDHNMQPKQENGFQAFQGVLRKTWYVARLGFNREMFSLFFLPL